MRSLWTVRASLSFGIKMILSGSKVASGPSLAVTEEVNSRIARGSAAPTWNGHVHRSEVSSCPAYAPEKLETI